MKTALGIWRAENEAIRDAGLWKEEGVLTTPQSAEVATDKYPALINMCANNYLGLSNHPAVKKAAAGALERWGYGLSSVRFICGTQGAHKELEAKLSAFLGMGDTILYSSCFDANGGLFETLTTAEDAIISDELNHASIIDGIRLSKAARYRYRNNDMGDLEAKLKEAAGARLRLIVTDGVFSMDGIIADLRGVCDLADKYDAAVVVDDSHAVGFIGETGRGSHEYNGVMGRVDILTGTLGKAMGGASGGYVSASEEVVALLRQRSRPYLFSNALAPSIAAASIAVIDMLTADGSQKARLDENTAYFRKRLREEGLPAPNGVHPIVPIMLGDERLAQAMAKLLPSKGVHAVGFFYPVVPKGKARIRTQVSAAHTREQLDTAAKALAAALAEAKGALGL